MKVKVYNEEAWELPTDIGPCSYCNKKPVYGEIIVHQKVKNVGHYVAHWSCLADDAGEVVQRVAVNTDTVVKTICARLDDMDRVLSPNERLRIVEAVCDGREWMKKKEIKESILNMVKEFESA